MQNAERSPLHNLPLLDHYRIPDYPLYYPRPANIKILFLCEGLAFDSSSGFSFKILIDLMRDNAAVSYANFQLTLARWGSSPTAMLQKDPTPGAYEATYTNYRFHQTDPTDNQLVLEKFDEVWLFGISPNQDFPVARNTILDSALCPSDEELQVLHKWMNEGGGVLAMGDHASLGANLVARIPRVWTMRKWTAEDGAPPRIGEDRIDTNRPMWAAQEAGAAGGPEEIPFEAQGDDVAQTIEVKRYRQAGYLFAGTRPHPVLCSRTEGVINHLPDHPHEGWCVEVQGVALQADVLFPPASGVQAREYPDVGGVPLAPEVIAWGNSSADPPLNLEKGETTSRKFGVIGAFDGHRGEIGRVVVDSTWHHWMSINLSGIYGFVPDENPLIGLKEANNKAYREIVDYFRNVGVWLAPKRKHADMLDYAAFYVVRSRYAFEDWRPSISAWTLGGEGRDVLGRATSKCFAGLWAEELIPSYLLERLQKLPKEFDPRDPFGPVCLTCPPLEALSTFALGQFLKEHISLREQFDEAPEELRKLGPEGLEKLLLRTRKRALAAIAEGLEKRLAMESKRLDRTVSELAKVAEARRKECG